MNEYLPLHADGSSPNVSEYVCEECGKAFPSLDENIEHYKRFHPRSIGTAIT
jgi:hypothetical protein